MNTTICLLQRFLYRSQRFSWFKDEELGKKLSWIFLSKISPPLGLSSLSMNHLARARGCYTCRGTVSDRVLLNRELE
ncbi:hypothetical protein Taro_037769 [Colocasia esculenta]|uniref:Uncharacterized protein n=1 Tax=Colocasia esculenta TaxID=4460 RepID=A0A843WK91_COLES|nr:hypothetical protein [Colocasia esculenta]